MGFFFNWGRNSAALVASLKQRFKSLEHAVYRSANFCLVLLRSLFKPQTSFITLDKSRGIILRAFINLDHALPLGSAVCRMGITIAALLSVGQVCLLQSACTAPSTRMPDVRLGLLGSCRNVMTNRICKRGRWDLVSYRSEVITDKIKPTCLYCCKTRRVGPVSCTNLQLSTAKSQRMSQGNRCYSEKSPGSCLFTDVKKCGSSCKDPSTCDCPGK